MVSVSLCFILKMTCVFIVSQLQSGLFSPAKIMVDLLSFYLGAKLLKEKKRLKKKKKEMRTLKECCSFLTIRD